MPPKKGKKGKKDTGPPLVSMFMDWVEATAPEQRDEQMEQWNAECKEQQEAENAKALRRAEKRSERSPPRRSERLQQQNPEES